MAWIDTLPWSLIVLLCLTLGLAPFAPPHLIEKLQMLARGTLVRPIDCLDLGLHALPWALLLLKSVRVLSR
ncbi:MAG: RND transporter [Acidobacteriota bacterium]|nr:RND transporter [Acidobacteriota bacterium]